MRHRNHRIVKLSFGGVSVGEAWVVTSPSLREDDTWDVLFRATSKRACEEYVADVDRRNTQRDLAVRG